jgi:purine-nucleoside phosphorylase
MNYQERVEQAVNFIRKQTDFSPQVAIILGTGLGQIAQAISLQKIIPYTQIPHFPVSTAPSHKGQIIFASLHKSKFPEV